MPIIIIYLFKEIFTKIVVTTLGFTLLFTFFNFIAQLETVGDTTFNLGNVLFIQVINSLGVIYEVLPIASLIGGLWAFATLASTSEFIVMRAGGLNPKLIFFTVVFSCVPFMIFSVLLSEILIPSSEKFTEKLQPYNKLYSYSQSFQSGFWLRDRLNIKNNPSNNLQIQERIVNFKTIDIKKNLKNITIFEFDKENLLVRRIFAENGKYEKNTNKKFTKKTTYLDSAGYWKLENPKIFEISLSGKTRLSSRSQLFVSTDLSSETIDALTIKPEKMSSLNLYKYISYLSDGNQKTNDYEIILWKKIFYPVVMCIMLLIALPAAYVQVRKGSVGLKVFLGILVGIGFHLLNGLFSHLGLINTWPPIIIAILPSLTFLFIGCITLLLTQKITNY